METPHLDALEKKAKLVLLVCAIAAIVLAIGYAGLAEAAQQNFVSMSIAGEYSTAGNLYESYYTVQSAGASFCLGASAISGFAAGLGALAWMLAALFKAAKSDGAL